MGVSCWIGDLQITSPRMRLVFLMVLLLSLTSESQGQGFIDNVMNLFNRLNPFRAQLSSSGGQRPRGPRIHPLRTQDLDLSLPTLTLVASIFSPLPVLAGAITTLRGGPSCSVGRRRGGRSS